MKSLFSSGVALVLAASFALAASEPDYARLRAVLVRVVEGDVRATARFLGKRALDDRVIEALASAPRHEFVPERQKVNAYLNRPLPIGHGQTISQPYIVAIMTDMLGIDADDVVLEVGTGSGYQAAVLAVLVKDVYTMEIIEPLGLAADARLERLGYDNVHARLGDGYYGWP
ncbi:MAG: protein-L-isoaspartate O-methyltransferase, partial [Alphaproteobacteria bacterium]